MTSNFADCLSMMSEFTKAGVSGHRRLDSTVSVTAGNRRIDAENSIAPSLSATRHPAPGQAAATKQKWVKSKRLNPLIFLARPARFGNACGVPEVDCGQSA
ncbi:hypothetical protein [Azonexus sp.]|uniref:hypothetical protein n=1 Tax=Azonexus sp. TaxID=1872668 RepID=UPI0035AEB1B1